MEIKFFKKEKIFKKAKESLWLSINFYWKLAILFVFVTIILASVFGYYLFSQINKDPVLLETVPSPQVGTIKKERIDKILLYFSVREEKTKQILNSYSPAVDPSL